MALNLCEILKGHEGETFYCSELYENVILIRVDKERFYFKDSEGEEYSLLYHGGLWFNKKVNCRFWPSENQRDWNKWDKENNKTPKTWSELLKKDYDLRYKVTSNPMCDDSGSSPIEKSALALLKINQLIEVGYGGNVSNEEWECPINTIYYIRTDGENFHIETNYNYPFCHIAFHTKEQAIEFLTYIENIQLLKDYFMI